MSHSHPPHFWIVSAQLLHNLFLPSSARVIMCNDINNARGAKADQSVNRVTFETQNTASDVEHLPPSTRWHRRNGRPSKRDKAVKQHLLTFHEERALADYILRMSRNGYPIPAKYLPFFAAVIIRQRVASSKHSTSYGSPTLPSKKWRLAFYRRHSEVKARRLIAIDWKRHDFHIYDKIAD